MYRLPDAVQLRVEEQYARDVARMNPGEAGKGEDEYNTFLAELGGTGGLQEGRRRALVGGLGFRVTVWGARVRARMSAAAAAVE